MAINKNSLTRLAAPALTGVLLTLCQPTGYRLNLGILAWIALVPLLVTLPGQSSMDRFWSGLTAGGVHYFTGLYWVVYTMNTYGNLNLPGSISVALLLATLETSYLILFVLAWGWVQENRPHVPMALGVPVIWVAVEVFRARFPFGGFPWLLLGYSQGGHVPVIQIADITGVYGVSFILALVNAAVARVVIRLRSREPFPIPSVAIAAILLGLTLIYGYHQKAAVLALESKGTPLKVALLQGNVRQDMKWNAAEEDRILGTYRRLTVEAAKEGAQLIVWPEASIPFAFERDTVGENLASWLEEQNTYILLGSIDYTWTQGDKPKPRFTNSAYLVSPDGIVGKYSKLHLVPFGEYIPMAKYLGFVDKIVKGATGNFNPGDGIKLLQIPQGKFGVIICYEAIFGELVRQFRNDGAELLINITNDAWFGDTSAPRQHLGMAAFRCAENHCYMIRAANTGITAVVDPLGRIIRQTGVYEEASIYADIKMMPGSTFYARHGDLFAWMISALAMAALLFETGIKLKDGFREKR